MSSKSVEYFSIYLRPTNEQTDEQTDRQKQHQKITFGRR